MFSQTIIYKRLEDLSNNRKKDLSSSYLKTGSIDEDFQQEGKQDSAKNLLYRLEKTGKALVLCRGHWLWMNQDPRLHGKPFWW